MTPKLICENYRCKIGDKGEVRVFGMTEYTGDERSAPGQYMAIVYVPGKSPEKYDTDSFENAVAMVAKAFDEPKDTVREALEASIPKDKRRSIEEFLANRSSVDLKAIVQKMVAAWRKGLKKFFALS